MHDVIDDDFAVQRILETNDGRNARARIGAFAPASVVAGLLAARHLLRAHLLQFLLGAITTVRIALGEQLLDHLLVAIESLGLKERPLVMIEARPLHAVENLLDGLVVERSRSVSSMRRMNFAACRRAYSQQNSAVRNPPMCKKPVGLGAKRVRTVMDPGLEMTQSAQSLQRPRDARRGMDGAAVCFMQPAQCHTFAC